MGNLIKSYQDFMKERNGNGPEGSQIRKTPEIEKVDDYDSETEKMELKHQVQNADKCPRCGNDTEHCTCTDDPWSTNVAFRAPVGKIEKAQPKQDFKGVKNKNQA